MEEKRILLKRIDSMTKNWAMGDVLESQKDYEYILEFCASANLNFNNILLGGLKMLLKQCVGVLDTQVVKGYVEGLAPGWLNEISAHRSHHSLEFPGISNET